MPAMIKEKVLQEYVVDCVLNFINKVADNESITSSDLSKSCLNIIDSLINSATIANGGEKGDKVAGRVKNNIINDLRSLCEVSLDSKITDQVAEWEAAAWEAYGRHYNCRRSGDDLCEAASRVMREIELGTWPESGVKKIHYKPMKSIIERFISKVMDGEFGELPVPQNDGTYLLDHNGEMIFDGVFEAVVSSYDSGDLSEYPEFKL